MSDTATRPRPADVDPPETAPAADPRPTVLALWLVVAGVIGWIAAFSLTLERLALLADPNAKASCDFSILYQCTANLGSWQGEVFGFPNPLIGITGWSAVVVVGMALLAGARFARWFWLAFWAGTAFAFGFVCWLIGQSIFAPNLGTLCPWCMVTWSVAIPTFYAVTLQLFRNGTVPLSAAGRERASRLGVWIPLAAIVSYAAIITLAQIRLDAINNIFETLQRLWS